MHDSINSTHMHKAYFWRFDRWSATQKSLIMDSSFHKY